MNPRNFRNSLAKNICTVCGLGNVPYAPGTFGSVVGVGLGIALQQLLPIWASVLVLVLGTVGATFAIRHLRTFWDGAGDDKRIIIDEVLGQALVLIWFSPTLLHLAVGFALFRFFDILKPWPISVIDQRMTGPFGVIADDLAAGVFAAVLLQLVALA